MPKQMEKHEMVREVSAAFPNKENTLDFIEKIHDMGWIDDKSYDNCIMRMGASCDDGERIDKLELSARAYNGLLRSDVYNLNQLRYLLLGNRHPQNNEDIFEIRNLGIQTVIEIMKIAINYGVLRTDEIGSSSKIFHNFSKWELCKNELLKQN